MNFDPRAGSVIGTTNSVIGPLTGSQAAWELYPDFVPPNPEAELRRAVDEAGQAAHETARRALHSGVDAGEVQRLVDKHGNDIALWGELALR